MKTENWYYSGGKFMYMEIVAGIVIGVAALSLIGFSAAEISKALKHSHSKHKK